MFLSNFTKLSIRVYYIVSKRNLKIAKEEYYSYLTRHNRLFSYIIETDALMMCIIMCSIIYYFNDNNGLAFNASLIISLAFLYFRDAKITQNIIYNRNVKIQFLLERAKSIGKIKEINEIYDKKNNVIGCSIKIKTEAEPKYLRVSIPYPPSIFSFILHISWKLTIYNIKLTTQSVPKCN